MFQRRVHTRGRAECSVAADGGRRTVGRRVGAHVKVTVDGRVVNVQKIAEPRAPIATKFTRKLTEAVNFLDAFFEAIF